jgi:hypothetical protein
MILHQSKTAMAVVCQQLVVGLADVVLIQESWIYGEQIRVLTSSGGTTQNVVPN